MTRSGLLAALAALTACTNAGLDPTALGFDPSVFDPIPAIESLDWSAVHPAAEWDYWAVRAGGMGSTPVVLGSGGALALGELGADVRHAVEAAHPSTGFSEGCPPGYCYRYVVAVADGEVTTFNTRGGLEAFLGGIDSAEEAVLRVIARSYTWWDEAGEHTGVRANGGGWDVVVLELVKHCAPIQQDRILMHVRPNGDVEERGREVWERSPNMCI